MAKRVILSNAEGEKLRQRMFFFVRKQKANSHGWIGGLITLLVKEFSLTPAQASYHMSVLVQEHKLVRKAPFSPQYRVATSNEGGGKKGLEQKAAGTPESRPPKGGQDAARQILANFAGQPGFQVWLKAEIAKTEQYLAELKKFRRE